MLARQVDVQDAAAVGAFVKEAERELGPLDAVVTNAGIIRDQPLVHDVRGRLAARSAAPTWTGPTTSAGR